MTIEKGQPWGTTAPLPADGVIVTTDAEASDLVAAARRSGAALPVIGLLGGDLCRTLGGTGDAGRMRSEIAATFPVDVGEVEVDGEVYPFVAHAVGRSRLWTLAAGAMNAQWIGDWNVAPRAHPNDGVLDVFEAHLPLGDLRKVRARLPRGDHLPHPGIAVSRTRSRTVSLDRAVDVWVDGRRVGRSARLAFTLQPDAVRVVV